MMGFFTSWPLKYAQGDMKKLNDTNFDEMLVGSFEKVYYCQTGAKLSLGIREIKSHQDIAYIVKVSYNNRNEVDMFVEHFGYDIMEMAEFDRNEEQNNNMIESSNDDYYSSDDYEEIENVDFYTKDDDSVVIKNIST
ncbi:hypothetical protein Tco_1528856 [Tanacetum coccineum]